MIHLILGDRGPRISKVVEKLAGHPAPNDLDTARLDVSETDLLEISVAVQTPPFIAPFRKIILLNAPTSKNDSPPRFWEWLTQIIESGPDGLLLIVVFYMNDLTTKVRTAFERRATKLKSETTEVQVLRELKGKGTRQDRAVFQWIREVVSEAGLKIDQETAEFLVQRSTVDAGALEQEVKKIAALKNFTGKISEADVRQADPHPAERSIWEYLDAVIGQRTGEALRIMSATLNQGEAPELVLGVLGRTIPQLILTKFLQEEELSPDNAARALGVQSWQASRLYRQASQFEMTELRTMLSALVDLDLDYKSGHLAFGGLRAGLEALTVRFCYRQFSERIKSPGA